MFNSQSHPQNLTQPFLFRILLAPLMDASKPESAKQLKEYLQHQQEPFSLQTCLSEKSYRFKNFSSGTTRNMHCLHSRKNLKRSVKCDLYNVRRRLLQAKGILRSILSKFILSGDFHEFSNWDGQHKSDQYVHWKTTGTQKKPKYGFFSKQKLAASENFTYHDVVDNLLSYEHRGSTFMSMFQTFTLPEVRRVEESVGDPMLSTYLTKRFMNLDIAKMGHVRSTKLRMVRTTICQGKKIILQTRKQLLSGRVGKSENFHENEGKQLPIRAALEIEDFENLIHEHFCSMEKQCAEVKTATHLLLTESFFTSEEWRNSNTQNWEMQREIGDAIMDDIVRETIVSFLG
ncbi:uncharacterized protein LOC129286083 [Prosopis cineraria]|uniref:uncharacterized protein LOC129286083 n=1 Tax=Prosopis cineraria TaxID=364024 RepID=UPI00240F8714|nr:uncharacterized protein LOC129286083 [Prosopis cineraria]